MDLRIYDLSSKDIAEAKTVLDYQPFIVNDDFQTGVAYSWLYEDDGGRNCRGLDLVMDRTQVSSVEWERFCGANARLRAMYEDWIEAIVARYRGGSIFDPACNNGYFLARALEKGMSRATGYDRVDYTRSVALLNRITGVEAEFHHRRYSSWTHTIEGAQRRILESGFLSEFIRWVSGHTGLWNPPWLVRHDVAIASAIMQHLSDPLYFLAFLGKVAGEAIFLSTGIVESDAYSIQYSEPNRFYKDDPFPVGFDNDTELSRGLLFKSLELMGFKNIEILPYRDSWLPKSFFGSQRAILASR